MSTVTDYNVAEGNIQDGDVSFFAYNENTLSSLEVFEGGWVRNSTGGSLTLSLPNPSSNALGRVVEDDKGIGKSWFESAANWQLILYMKDGERVSNLGAVGMRPDATGGLDKTDLVAPPLVDATLSFRMVDGLGISRNFKPLQAGQEWDYSIAAPLHNRVTISWDDETVSKLNDKLYLYDPVSNVSYNMSAINSIELPATSSFKVVYGDAVDEATIHVPILVYPNPTQDVVSVQFFPEGDDVEISAKLTIFGMDGRVMREVKQQFYTETVGTFDLENLELSSGTYLIQVNYGERTSQPEKLIIK